MVSRPPRVRRLGTLKSQRHKFEFLNESIDGTHRIVFGDPVVQSLREKHRLLPTLAFDESLHGAPPQATAIILPEHCTASSHNLGRTRSLVRHRPRAALIWTGRQLARLFAAGARARDKGTGTGEQRPP